MNTQQKTTAQDHINRFGIFNKIEVLSCVDEWMRRIDAEEYIIPLCKRSKEILRIAMLRFRKEVMHAYVPVIRENLMSYELFIERDSILLAVVKWNDDVEFLNDDFVDYDGDVNYKTVAMTKIGYSSLDTWAETNNISSETALKWIYEGRLPAVNNNGVMTISPIQYLPDAPHEAKIRRRVRYSSVGEAPQSFATKHPALNGKILDLMFLPVGNQWSMMAIVIPKEGENSTTYSSIVLDEEKKDIISELITANKIKPTDDKKYISPIGRVSMSGRTRVNVLKSMPAKTASVYGKCEGSCYSCISPRIGLVLYDEKSKSILCEATGYASKRSYESREYRFLSYVFGAEDPCNQIRNYIQNRLYPESDKKSAWNDSILLIETTEMHDTKEEDMIPFFNNIAGYTKQCFLFEPVLVAFKVKCDESGKLAEILEKSGFAVIPASEDFGEDIYYAYNPFATAAPIVVEPINKKDNK